MWKSWLRRGRLKEESNKADQDWHFWRAWRWVLAACDGILCRAGNQTGRRAMVAKARPCNETPRKKKKKKKTCIIFGFCSEGQVEMEG